MKILIADDEKKVCQLIYHLIDWEDKQFIGFANNGEEAFEMLIKEQVDLLITDIRMPGLSGIDLIKKIREHDKDIKIIIISGYDDFEYAQSALRYGVSDYILKPVKRQTLAKAINKLAKTVVLEKKLKAKNNTSLSKDKLYRLILEDFSESASAEFEKIFSSGFGYYQLLAIEVYEKDSSNIFKPYFNKVLSELKNDKNLNLALEYISFENRMYIILKHDLDVKVIKGFLEAKLADLLALSKDLSVLIAVSNSYKLLSEISLERVNRSILEKFVHGLNRIYLDLNDDENVKRNPSAYKYVFSIDDLLASDTKDVAILSLINGFKASLQEESKENQLFGYEIILHIASFNRDVILELIKKDYLQYEFKRFNEFEDALFNQIDLDHAFKLLSQNLKQVFDEAMQNIKGKDATPIKRAKDYINAHYMQDISLSLVSEEIGLNASYFSTLFKKETGENFATYVSRLRIEKAKRLISTTNYKIGEITELVGYYDLSSFNKKFKKYTGLSPKEYRKLKS